MTAREIGFVGLGNMGAALAENLVAKHFTVVAHDIAGPRRTPPGATFVDVLEQIAARADVVVCSLPDGEASHDVAGTLATARGRVKQVVDTSTIGVMAAQEVAALLARSGIAYVDAPVSGGVAGARARTLAIMYSANDDDCAAVEPVLRGLSDRRFRVGRRAGLGQAMKLANNFLSATALAATSEAIAFGESVGLEPATMVEVLNASSGHNTATSDKYPNHVATGRFASGFANSLMAKDISLYLRAVDALGTPSTIAWVTRAIWSQFAAAEPGADFTRVFPWVASAPPIEPRPGDAR
jgi:3-hydroxyisobutyrate dehydrogenase-like beta-hydroxyacid dehydrogenase